MSDLPGAPPRDIDPAVLRDRLAELSTQIARLTQTQEPPPTVPLASKEHPKCFVIMPFGIADLEDLYNEFILPVLTECNLDCSRGDSVFGSNVIMEDVKAAIAKADLVVADLERAQSERVLRSRHCGHNGEAGVATLTVGGERPLRRSPSPGSSLPIHTCRLQEVRRQAQRARTGDARRRLDVRPSKLR